MKRTAGIFLLSIYIFSFAEVHNLVKIPVLFQHFKEHKQEDPSISFWDFIKIHYMDPIVVDDDYQRDQQLPFRDAGCCQLVNISDLLLFCTGNYCLCRVLFDLDRQFREWRKR